MFSVRQKREIADAVQRMLRETNHPELPTSEIEFHLHVKGAGSWSWADIHNNGAVTNPGVNPHNERQDDLAQTGDHTMSEWPPPTLTDADRQHDIDVWRDEVAFQSYPSRDPLRLAHARRRLAEAEGATMEPRKETT